ncbi:MAG: hypothetical protein ACYC2H_01825 [Thermoplasmatota archaeon]
MGFEPYGLLILGHVLFASLWFGAGVYQVLVIGRGLMAAGPAAGGFIVALMKNGGIGRFFAISGILTILFGGALYGQLMSDGSIETFSGRGLWLTLGAIVAVGAFIHGLTVNMPTERKLMSLAKGLKGPPTKEQAAEMGALGQKLGKAGRHGVALVGTSMLLMLLSRVFV